MRIQFELEYTLNSSPRLLFARLSTPEGLSEWFADDVAIDGDVFIFHWQTSEARARLAAIKENKMVRFEWLDREDEESNYFEFRLTVDDITNDVALLITDFADPDEKDDAIYLWDTQIADLKRILGI